MTNSSISCEGVRCPRTAELVPQLCTVLLRAANPDREETLNDQLGAFFTLAKLHRTELCNRAKFIAHCRIPMWALREELRRVGIQFLQEGFAFITCAHTI